MRRKQERNDVLIRWCAWHETLGALGPSLSRHRTLSVGYRDSFCQSEENRAEWPVVRVEIRRVKPTPRTRARRNA